MTEPATLECLAQLWLSEPDAAGIARAKALGVCDASCAAEPASLAVAYADLFILNVYPYGTVYTDAWGEINTPAVRRTAALYEAHGFDSPDLSAVGAPDHLGLCLAFLGQLLSAPGTARIAGEQQASSLSGTPALRQKHRSRHTPERATTGASLHPVDDPPRGVGGGGRFGRGADDIRPSVVRDHEHFLGEVSFWAPVCCLAAERDPTAHEFYRAVARSTRESLLSALPLAPAANEEPCAATQPGAHAGPFGVDMQADDEVRLRDIVRFLLAPARCGMFLSRSRLGMIARGLGLRLPFGSRFEVAEWLFSSAGQSDMLRALIAALGVEADAAEACYAGSAERWPAWRPAASAWLECVNSTRRTLLKMEMLADCAGAIFLT